MVQDILSQACTKSLACGFKRFPWRFFCQTVRGFGFRHFFSGCPRNIEKLHKFGETSEVRTVNALGIFVNDFLATSCYAKYTSPRGFQEASFFQIGDSPADPTSETGPLTTRQEFITLLQSESKLSSKKLGGFWPCVITTIGHKAKYGQHY